MGIFNNLFGSHNDGVNTEWPKVITEGDKIDMPNADDLIAELGYEKIEENEELAKYRKVELYGRKTVEVYLSSDDIALVKCYDQFTGETMAMTFQEMNHFTLKMVEKFKPVVWSKS